MKISQFIILLFCTSIYSQEKIVRANCSSDYKQSIGVSDSIIIRTCILKNFKFVSTGNPDYKGRYFWDYEVYKLVGEKYVKTTNSDIIKNLKTLEKFINERIEQSYESDIKNGELAECMSLVELKKFNLDEIQISFDDNDNTQFITSFGLPSACLNIDRTIVHMSTTKFVKYLK